MKTAEAPRPGWYPDPERRAQLRWWEGADWTDDRRPKPNPAAQAVLDAAAIAAESGPVRRRAPAPPDAVDGADLVAQVRTAARREADRVKGEISRGVEDSLARLRPLIVDYIAKILRWIRIGIVTAAVLVVVWFTIQFIAQAAFLQWLGDRVDNLTS